MKAGSSMSIPMAMIFRKFYCHKCGEKLYNNPNTRLVSPKDADWNKHSRIGKTRMLPIGDIEVTTYNFKCPVCQSTIEFDEQVIVSKIQKKNRTILLSDSQIENDLAWAKAKTEKEEKLKKYVWYVICSILLAIILLGTLSGGEFSIHF